jgi:hypothetical protein
MPGRLLADHELQEVKSMLAERVKEWTEEWKQEGLQEAAEQARAILRQDLAGIPGTKSAAALS